MKLADIITFYQFSNQFWYSKQTFEMSMTKTTCYPICKCISYFAKNYPLCYLEYNLICKYSFLQNRIVLILCLSTIQKLSLTTQLLNDYYFKFVFTQIENSKIKHKLKFICVMSAPRVYFLESIKIQKLRKKFLIRALGGKNLNLYGMTAAVSNRTIGAALIENQMYKHMELGSII